MKNLFIKILQYFFKDDSKFPKFVLSMVALIPYLLIILYNINKMKQNREEYTNELLYYGSLLQNIQIKKEYDSSYKGIDYKNYFYEFFIEGERYKGMFKIKDIEKNPVYMIKDSLTILYSEMDPRIHTILKIKNDLTVLPPDTITFIDFKIGTSSKKVAPTKFLIDAYLN